MPRPPYPAEPHHADIDWTEKDNRENYTKFGIDFTDVKAGLASTHVRLPLSDTGLFTAIVTVSGRYFELLCKQNGSLQIYEAQLATHHAKATYRKTLFKPNS